MRHCAPDPLCRPTHVRHRKLRAMVRSYILHYRRCAQKELDGFRSQHFLEALERATLAQDTSGKRFSHQRRIPLAALRRAKNLLGDAAQVLHTKDSFEDLHNSIKGLLDGVRGLGELYCYDAALRIASNLGNEVLPKRIYLHRGTREGARALGLDWRADSLDPHTSREELSGLEPYEMEDFLCIYRAWLRPKMK